MLFSVLQFPNRTRQRFQRHADEGAPPGTIATDAEAGEPTIRVMCYSGRDLEESEVRSADDLAAFRDRPGVTWIDVHGLGDAQTIVRIGELFGLHPLALEDVVNVHQRPKVEMYDDCLFFIVRAHPGASSLNTEQVAMFLTHGLLITFREKEVDCLDQVRQRVRGARGRVRTYGADYLLYALLDAVVDGYFPVLETYGEQIDELDRQVLVDEGGTAMIGKIHEMRGNLLEIRRAIWPLRDAINGLIRDSGDLITDETDLYLRDCYDHTIQIIDVVETDRELCTDLRDLCLTVASNRMNQVMQFLTIIATLFIPLSFITGVYGMNFNPNASPWNMPELNWYFGYPFALGLMGTTAVTLFLYFWRKGWLW